MKKNIGPLLAIAFVVAILSTGLFYGVFANRLNSASSDLPRHAVVVANRKIASGTVMTASDVRVAEMRSQTAFAKAFTKPEQVIGATTLEPLEETQVVTKTVVAAPSSAAWSLIPAGMRAVTVHVFESGGVLALLRPGSKVDVQAVFERNNLVALRTILQDIDVLSIGTQPEIVAGRFSAPVVTLLVRAADSDLLAVADTGSRLRLALRNRLDDGSAPHASLAVSSLFSGQSDRASRDH